MSLRLTIIILVILVAGMQPVQAGAVQAEKTTQSAPLPAPNSPSAATFNITWQTYCSTPPAEAVTAFTYATGIWGALISSSVPIEISACWTTTMPCAGIACGDTAAYYRNFTAGNSAPPMVDTFYPSALANALAGTDLDPISYDIEVSFDSSQSWSFETSGSPGLGIDFVSVALHEITHGLGFAGNLYESYNVGFCGTGPLSWYPCPTAYDRFAVDSAGVALLSYLDTNPLTLGTKLKSDAHFGGPNTIARNTSAARLYTPSIWDHGSSFSHLDPGTFGSGSNVLMLPTYQNGVRAPGSVTLAMLQDMGWLLTDGSPNLAASGPSLAEIGEATAYQATLEWAGYSGQPLAYVWTVSDLGVFTHTVSASSDTISLSWPAVGLKSVVVTAKGSGITISATRLVRAQEPLEYIYLPAVAKGQ
jgi:hypothetical protein